MKQKIIIIILYIIISVMIVIPVGIFLQWLFFESGIKLNFTKQNQQEVSSEYIYDFDKSEYIFASTQNEWFEISKKGKWYDVRFSGSDVDKDVVQQFTEAGQYNKDGREMKVASSSITLTDDGLVVISGSRCICYLDVINKKIIKVIPLEDIQTIAVNVGGRDILFLTAVIYTNMNLIRTLKSCYTKQKCMNSKYLLKMDIKILHILIIKKMKINIFLSLMQL